MVRIKKSDCPNQNKTIVRMVFWFAPRIASQKNSPSEFFYPDHPIILLFIRQLCCFEGRASPS